MQTTQSICKNKCKSIHVHTVKWQHKTLQKKNSVNSFLFLKLIRNTAFKHDKYVISLAKPRNFKLQILPLGLHQGFALDPKEAPRRPSNPLPYFAYTCTLFSFWIRALHLNNYHGNNNLSISFPTLGLRCMFSIFIIYQGQISDLELGSQRYSDSTIAII